MDPKQTWDEMLVAANRVANASTSYEDGKGDAGIAADAVKMSDAILALAEWIHKGGFCPFCSL